MVRDFIQPNSIEQKLFSLFMVILVCTTLLYAGLLRATVGNVVARRVVEEELSAVRSRIGSREAAYLLRSNAVTENVARELGFVVVKNPHFISRTTVAPALTLNSANVRSEEYEALH